MSKINSYLEFENKFQSIFKLEDIGMVICNAGLDFPGLFCGLSAEEIDSVMKVNVLHPVYLSKLALDYLPKRVNNLRSRVMQVSS